MKKIFHSIVFLAIFGFLLSLTPQVNQFLGAQVPTSGVRIITQISENQVRLSNGQIVSGLNSFDISGADAGCFPRIQQMHFHAPVDQFGNIVDIRDKSGESIGPDPDPGGCGYGILVFSEEAPTTPTMPVSTTTTTVSVLTVPVSTTTTTVPVSTAPVPTTSPTVTPPPPPVPTPAPTPLPPPPLPPLAPAVCPTCPTCPPPTVCPPLPTAPAAPVTPAAVDLETALKNIQDLINQFQASPDKNTPKGRLFLIFLYLRIVLATL